MVTNGVYIGKWLDLYCANHVRISLDASNQEEHTAMHGKSGDFERVCHNIGELCQYDLEVGISYLVSDANAKASSFQRILEFASNAGVDFIHFRPLSEESPQRFTGDWDAIAKEIEMMAPAVPSVKDIRGRQAPPRRVHAARVQILLRQPDCRRHRGRW